MRERERERERERIRVCVESEAKGFQRSIARVDEHVGFPATIVRWLVVLRAEARCYFADPSLLGRPPPLRLHGVRVKFVAYNSQGTGTFFHSVRCFFLARSDGGRSSTLQDTSPCGTVTIAMALTHWDCYSSNGFNPVYEAVSLVVGRKSPVPVQLTPPATCSLRMLSALVEPLSLVELDGLVWPVSFITLDESVRPSGLIRGCLECCTKPAPTITVDEPSRGLKIQGQTMKKSSVTEEILSTSTHDMENSRAQSQRSMSSISTLAPASLDHHGMGSTSNALEFVNHGLVLWNQTRQQWIGDKKPIVQPRRVQESRLRWNATYDNLLVSNKPFPRPVPLWEMIHFLADCKSRLPREQGYHGFIVVNGVVRWTYVISSVIARVTNTRNSFLDCKILLELSGFPEHIRHPTISIAQEDPVLHVSWAIKNNSKKGWNSTTFTCISLSRSCSSYPTCNETLAVLMINSLVEDDGRGANHVGSSSLSSMYLRNSCLDLGVIEVAKPSLIEEAEEAPDPGLPLLLASSTEALDFFALMRRTGVHPDGVTFTVALAASANLLDPEPARQLHSLVLKSGFGSDLIVKNAVITSYARAGHSVEAHMVFDEMPFRDSVTWNSLLCVRPDHNAIHLFNVMRLQDMQPNDVTFVALIFAVNDQLLREGQMIHGVGFKLGIAEELNVSNSLITMYAKLKMMVDARKVFDAIHCKEIVSWNALVSGYAQNGQLEDALAVFSSLILHCMPNQYTFGSILSAITTTEIVSLAYGQSFHAHILKLGLNANAYVSVALIDLYAKRGSIDESRRAFEEAPLKSLITWTSIISAHSKHGNYEEVMSLFESLKRTGIHPDHITFLAVLVACCCKGKVDMGRKVFDSMVDEFEIEPWQEHYACMVDMLGKAGRLEEAEEFLQLAPMPLGISALQSLLGACRVHRNAEMGSRMAEALMKVEPTESGAYVLMSNIYAEKGEWENVAKLRRGMRQRGVRKEIGFSWVDVGSGESLHMHRFSSGDKTHPLAEEIHSMAESLGMEISYKKEDSDMGFYFAATN
ncbi:hypothetical protein ZIOFF_057920 [Zingiber officinale]|uniref:Gag1-like clamp domain-containing protein n=1 Tax=Zingiber officinale TaxID=94328 RepID=A0A8J5KLF8_ZINOF|nr:hypothetical protein ZIOFF_057920 [Zingiber officinale]